LTTTFRSSFPILLALCLGALAGCDGAPKFKSADITGADYGKTLQLTDQNGKLRRLEDFRGQAVVLFFGFTHCPDVCPTTLFEVSEIMRALGPDAGGVRSLFVTVDPERDTPGVLKDYLSSFDPHLRAATGSQAQLDKIEKAYRVYSKKVPTGKDGDYSMDHSAIVYLMDKQGRFVAPFKLDRKPEDAAAELRKYL